MKIRVIKIESRKHYHNAQNMESTSEIGTITIIVLLKENGLSDYFVNLSNSIHFQYIDSKAIFFFRKYSNSFPHSSSWPHTPVNSN